MAIWRPKDGSEWPAGRMGNPGLAKGRKKGGRWGEG
jgi:hypothetical protein